MESSAESQPKKMTRGHSMAILGSSGLAALSSLGITVVVKRFLEGESLTEFLLFWSLLFALYGVVVGIQQEATRAVGTARRDGKTGARIAPVGALVGLIVGGLTLVTSPLWAPAQIPLSGFSGVLLLSAGVALYAMHMTLYGASAGQESWYLFASVSGFDAIWRIVAICAVGLVSAHLIGLEAAAVSPVLLWLLMVLLLPEARRVFSSRADVSSGRLLYNYTLSMGSSTANAVLMMGLPLLLNVSIDSNDPLQQVILAVLILAISITRSPIMIPLQAFQGVAVSAFLKQQNHPLRAFAKPAGALLGVGLVGAAGPVAVWSALPAEAFRGWSVRSGGDFSGACAFGVCFCFPGASGVVGVAGDCVEYAPVVCGWLGAGGCSCLCGGGVAVASSASHSSCPVCGADSWPASTFGCDGVAGAFCVE